MNNYETNLDERLDAMLESPNADDVPFLVACIRHWQNRAYDAERDPIGEANFDYVKCPTCGRGPD